MKDVLIELGCVDAKNISEIAYDEEINEITMKVDGVEYRYKVENSIETYLLNYEDPLYVSRVGRERRDR